MTEVSRTSAGHSAVRPTVLRVMSGMCALAVLVAGCGGADETPDAADDIQGELERNNATVVGSEVPGDTGTRSEPLAIGTEVDLANGWRVAVNSAQPDGNSAVAAAYAVNEPAAPGMRYAVVNLTATHAADAEAAEFPAVEASVFGSDGVERTTLGAFATPPEPRFDAINEVAPGSSVTGNIVYEVGAEETDLVLHVRPAFSYDSSEAWIELG